MSDYLKPCAHCGGTGIDIREDKDCEHCTYASGKRFRVTCSRCYLSIIRDTEEEAIAAWNLRVSPSWSMELPAEEGWYLICYRVYEDQPLLPYPVYVMNRNGWWVTDYGRDMVDYPVDSYPENTQWCRLDVHTFRPSRRKVR